MSTTVALFGATGNVGKELLQALEKKSTEGTNFLIFSRTEPKEAINDDSKFKHITLPKKEDKGTDTDALADRLKGVETCFLCIPQMLVGNAKEYTEDLIQAWKVAGVKRVVKVGTGNAKQYEYGRCHIAAEQAIRDAGIQLTVVEGGDYSTNPHWLGPAPPGAPYVLIDLFKGMSYLVKLGLTPFRSMGNVADFFCSNQEPFMDLRDFAEALVNCLLTAKDHEGKLYRVYSEKVSMQQVADVYSDLLGRKLHVLDMSEDEIRTLMGMNGMKGDFLELIMDMFAQFRKGVYVPDESWDGFQKLCPGQTPRTFQEFANDKVAASFKPIKSPFYSKK